MSKPRYTKDCDGGLKKKLKYSSDNNSSIEDRDRQQVVNEEENDHQKDLSPSADSTVATTTSTAAVFWDQYYVVKRILEYLKLPDLLLRAGLVNREWSEIARIVRKQRKNRPFPVLIHPYTPHHKLAFEYFNSYRVSETAKELVESGREGYHPYSKQRRTSRNQAIEHKFGDFGSRAKEALKEAVVNAYDEAQVVLNFGTESFYDQQFDEQEDERMSVFLGGIQDTIPCVTCISCGVVGTAPEPEGNYSLEMESWKLPCLSTLAIPKVAGLGVKIFTISKEQNRSLERNANVQTCKEILGIDDTIEAQLQGIVLLQTNSNSSTKIVDAISQYLRVNPHVALAGGLHNEVLVSGVADTDDTIAAGLLIYGDNKQHLRVSSVALQDSKMSATNLKKMEKLQSSLLPGGNSFAFMFACNGRGRRMHGRTNVECEHFNKLFPQTPLVGAFTYGEYCHEVLWNSSDDEDETVAVPPNKVYFAYTTAYLVVSYKHSKDGPQGTLSKSLNNFLHDKK